MSWKNEWDILKPSSQVPLSENLYVNIRKSCYKQHLSCQEALQTCSTYKEFEVLQASTCNEQKTGYLSCPERDSEVLTVTMECLKNSDVLNILEVDLFTMLKNALHDIVQHLDIPKC